VRDTFSYDRGWKIVRMEVVVTVMDHDRKETMGSSCKLLKLDSVLFKPIEIDTAYSH